MAVETVATFFDEIVPKRLEKDPEGAKSIAAIYQFNITGDGGGEWVMDFTAPSVRSGADENAQCTVTMTDADFLGVLNGTLNPVQAFMMGKIQVAGNMALAMKLQQVLSTG